MNFFQSITHHYISPIRSFNRSARLFLWMTVINGIILSSWQLFFNFYMLESGFSRDFLGLATALPSLAALILGFPIGRLSDRIGRRPSLIPGILLASFTLIGEVAFRKPVVILSMWTFFHNTERAAVIKVETPLTENV